MNEKRLRDLISGLKNGSLSEEKALEELKVLPFENLGFACIDQHRQLRQGLPEVIYCPGKSSQQIAEIAERLKAKNDLVLATRASAAQAADLKAHDSEAQYFEEARMLIWGNLPLPGKAAPAVCLVTAGTADLPVAKEAELTLAACGIASSLYADLGVAGLQRILTALPVLNRFSVCLVFAGMDGALPSVIAGLLSCPVIACPTSVGYGTAFQGLAPLLSMLNSCAAGLTVVNIDNGFGAALAAFRILNKEIRLREKKDIKLAENC